MRWTAAVSIRRSPMQSVLTPEKPKKSALFKSLWHSILTWWHWDCVSRSVPTCRRAEFNVVSAARSKYRVNRKLKNAIAKMYFDIDLTTAIPISSPPHQDQVNIFVSPTLSLGYDIARTVCLAYSSAKKRRHILETHWLALSMLIVILARGHGSGNVERQCSNSDVSSGATTESSLSFGLYLAVSAVALPSAALCMYFRSIAHCLELGAMLANHCSKVFTCTDGCPASTGSIFRVVFGRCGKYVSCFFFRWSGWFRTPGGCAWLFQHRVLAPPRCSVGWMGCLMLAALATHRRSKCLAVVWFLGRGQFVVVSIHT